MRVGAALLSGLCASLLALSVQGAGSEMRVVSRQSYVMGYELRGHILMPVMGTIENGVIIGKEESAPVFGEESSESLYPDNAQRKKLDKFFTDSRSAEWLAEGRPERAAPAPPKPPVITGLVRLTGTLTIAPDGSPLLIVTSAAGEIQYDLSANEHIQETLAGMGGQPVRGHLTGIVSAGEPRPGFYIQSGWLEMM